MLGKERQTLMKTKGDHHNLGRIDAGECKLSQVSGQKLVRVMREFHQVINNLAF